VKEIHLHIRIDSDTDQQLEDFARRMKVSKSGIARMLLNDGLAKFDSRFEAFSLRLDDIAEMINRTHTMAAAAVAAIALPLGTGRRLKTAEAEEFKQRVFSSVYFGNDIKTGHDNGTLTAGDDNVSPN
jgi:predicted transcriptional regulator